MSSKLHRTAWAAGLLAALLLVSFNAGAAVTHVRSASSGLLTNASTASVTINADGAQFLIVSVQGTRNGGALGTATVTFAGQATTAVPNGDIEARNSQHYVRSQTFYYVNTVPYAGNQTVQATLTNAASSLVVGVVALSGVSPSSPIQASANDAAGSNETAQLTLNTADDGTMVVWTGCTNGTRTALDPLTTPAQATTGIWVFTATDDLSSEAWYASIPNSQNSQVVGFDGPGPSESGLAVGISVRPGDLDPPDLVTTGAIVRADANPTNAATVNWTVTFDEAVTGVDADDFALATTGGISGAALGTVSGSGTTWNVAAGTGTGNGTLQLNLVDNDTIVDLAGNKLGGTGTGAVYNGEAYDVDKTPPTSCSVAINGTDEWTNSVDVTLTLASTGATQMRFNNGFTWSSWETVGTSKSWTLIAGDGEKEVLAEFRDAALNVTQVSDTIKLDETDPTGQIQINGGAAATNLLDVTINVSADTDYSGVSQMQLSSDGVVFGSWLSFAATAPFTLDAGDGQKMAYARLRDAAGNESVVLSDSIILDQGGPDPANSSVVIDGDAAYTTDLDVTLTLSATDDFGTVDYMRISNDNVTWTRVSYAPTYGWTLAGPDGVNTVYVQFEDNLGNLTPKSDDIILDMGLPTGTMSINSDAEFTNDTAVSVVVTTTDTDIADIQLSNDNSTWSGWQPFDGSALSFSVLAGDGVKTVYAQLRDDAGNVSTAEISDTITLDQTAPTGSVVIAGGASAVNDAAVTLTVDATDNLSGVVSMRFSNDGAAWSTPEAYAASKNWLLLSGDGEKTVYVKFIDGAGNESSGDDAIDVVTLDTVDPPAPTVMGPALTNDSTPMWSWLSNDPAATDETTWSNQLDGGDWSSFSGDTNFTAGAALDDGEHTLNVVERDAAGNESEQGFFTIMVDTTAPAAPVVNGPVLTRNLQPTWSWVSGDGGSGPFRFQLNAQDDGDWTETAESVFSPADPLPDKQTHTLYVQQSDAAGNWSASGYWDVFVDSEAVTAPSVTGDTPTNDTTPVWTWITGGGLEQYRYQFDADEEGGWTETTDTEFESPVDLAEGTYTLYVQERLSELMWSQSGSWAITVDLTPPAPPTVNGPAITSSNMPVWTWAQGDPAGNGTFRYLLNCSEGGDWTEIAFLAWSPEEPLADGVHTLCVQERDQAGNWSESGTFAVEVDTVPPAPPVVDVPAITSSRKPTWSWVSGGGGNGTYQVQLDGEAGVWTTVNGTAFTPGSDLADGEHTLYVQERDDASNWSDSGSATVDVQPNPTGAPVVTSPAVTNNPQPTWTWVSGGGTGNFRYQMDSDAGDWVATTETSFVPEPLAAGQHTLYVQEASVASVWSASGSSTTLIDFTAPNAPVVTGPAVTANAKPTWSWTSGGGGGNGTYRYQLGVTTGDWTVTTATEFTPAEDLESGVYILFVQETDDAGNWSPAGSWSLRVKLIGPEPPVVSGPEVTANLRPLWTWVSGGNGNGRFRYQLNSESGPWQLTVAIQYRPIAPLEEGSYTLYVQEQDSLGNWSESGSWIIVIDLQPPAPPILSGATPTRNTQPTWTWTPGGGGAGLFRVQIDSEDDAWTVTTGLSYSPPLPLEKNAHTLYAQEADAAGNWSVSSLYTIVIDPNAVNPPVVTGDTPTNDTTPAWSWTSGGGGEGRYRYRLDGGAWVITLETTFSPGVDLAQGNHTLEVCESNAFGDWSWPGDFTINISLGLPVITILGDNPAQVSAGTDYADAGATAVDAESVDITEDIVTTGLPVDTSVVGTYEVRYNVTDAADNRATEAVRTVNVVSGVTEVAVTSPLPGSTLYVSADGMPVLVALTSVAPEGTASVSYTFDGVEVGTATEAPWLVVIEVTPSATIFGDYTIGAAADADASTDQATLTIAEIPAGSDEDANGIPDNPFTTLGSGDLWAQDGVVVLRTDGEMAVPAGAPNVVALANPANTQQRLIAVVSPSLLEADETAAVILKASGNLVTLLGAEQAALVAAPPVGYVVAGNFYGTVNIAVTDDGVNFSNMDGSLLADFPVIVTAEDNLADEVDLLVHGADVMADDQGIFIGVPAEAAWGNDGVVELNVVDGAATATLRALGLVAAFETSGEGEGEGEGETPGPQCFASSLQPPSSPGSGDGMVLLLMATALLVPALRLRPKFRSIR